MATRHRTQVSRGNDGERPYKLASECLSALSARSGSSSNRQIRTMRDYSLIPFLFGVSAGNFYARRGGCRNRLFYKNPLKLLSGEDLNGKFICFVHRKKFATAIISKPYEGLKRFCVACIDITTRFITIISKPYEGLKLE